MTTPINGTRLGTHPQGTEPQTSRPGPASGGQVNTGGADEVALSPAARQLSTPAGGDNVVPFDAARVAQLREAIADGTYHVDPQRLAERFAAFELTLSGEADNDG